jgi:nucleoporin NDC1
MGLVAIKWNTPIITRRDIATTTKKRGSPLHAKACAMADVLKNSIYGIMSTFHEKMLTSTKIGLLDKNWVAKIKPLFGT